MNSCSDGGVARGGGGGHKIPGSLHRWDGGHKISGSLHRHNDGGHNLR